MRILHMSLVMLCVCQITTWSMHKDNNAKHAFSDVSKGDTWCSECNFTFPNVMSFKQHQNRLHSGWETDPRTPYIKLPRTKPDKASQYICLTSQHKYRCTACGHNEKRFAVVLEHVRTCHFHSPYECVECGRQEYQASKMRSHVEQQHMNDNNTNNNKKRKRSFVYRDKDTINNIITQDEKISSVSKPSYSGYFTYVLPSDNDGTING